jgi:hypothetical protein
MDTLENLQDLNRLADEMAALRTTTSTVLVVLPTYGDVKADMMYDLVRTVMRTAVEAPYIRMKFMKGSSSLLVNLRNELTDKVLESKAEWSWWIDSDMRFPTDALARLIQHDKDIVGANYITRSMPPRPTAKLCSDDGQNYYDFATMPDDTGLVPVDALGMGCILIRSKVFEALEWPFFSTPPMPQRRTHVGEDVYMMAHAIEKGFQPYVDHDLSHEIGHVGSFVYRWGHYYTVQALMQEQPTETPAVNDAA